MDQLSQDVGYWVVLALVVAAASAVGFQNVGVLRFLGRPLAVGMTAALDLVYDISSYLRIGQPGIVAPRIKMVARYRALLAHLRDAGYTRVVVCAHSRGAAGVRDAGGRRGTASHRSPGHGCCPNASKVVATTVRRSHRPIVGDCPI